MFARFPRAGRTGTAEHVQKELAIPHRVKSMQTISIPRGTKYQRPSIRKGEKNTREVVIHGRIPANDIVSQRDLPRLSK